MAPFLDATHGFARAVVYETGGVWVRGCDFHQIPYYKRVILGAMHRGGP